MLTFDITKYGANADISEAVGKAFKEACQSTSPSTIVIPKGTFQMNQVKLEGPCKGPLELQIQATLKALSDPNQIKTGEWLTVNKLDFFTMSVVESLMVKVKLHGNAESPKSAPSFPII